MAKRQNFFLGGVSKKLFGGESSRQTTTTPNVPAWYKDAVQGVTERAGNVFDGQFDPYEGQRIAGFNQDQERGFDLTRQFAEQQAQQGLSNPYAAGAEEALFGALDRSQQGLDDYMDPYLENVLAPARANLDESFNKNIRNLAARVGPAYGGSRYAFAEGNMFDDYQQNLAQLEYGARSDAFNQAQSYMARDTDRMQGIGSTLFGAGEKQEQDFLQGAGALQGIGVQQQQNQQSQLDFDFSEFMREVNQPREDMMNYANIIYGAPTGIWGTTTTGPKPTGLQQLGGIADVAGGFMNLARGKADGGYVSRKNFKGGGLASLAKMMMSSDGGGEKEKISVMEKLHKRGLASKPYYAEGGLLRNLTRLFSVPTEEEIAEGKEAQARQDAKTRVLETTTPRNPNRRRGNLPLYDEDSLMDSLEVARRGPPEQSETPRESVKKAAAKKITEPLSSRSAPTPSLKPSQEDPSGPLRRLFENVRSEKSPVRQALGRINRHTKSEGFNRGLATLSRLGDNKAFASQYEADRNFDANRASAEERNRLALEELGIKKAQIPLDMRRTAAYEKQVEQTGQYTEKDRLTAMLRLIGEMSATDAFGQPTPNPQRDALIQQVMEALGVGSSSSQSATMGEFELLAEELQKMIDENS